MRKGVIFIAFIVYLHQPSKAQDSARIFTQKDLYFYLKTYHPLSKQAELQIKKGENEVRKSRGKLDPVLQSNLDQKTLNDQSYYNLFSGGLKVPTWYAVDFKAAYEHNRGINLNPESETPADGLLLLGASVPLSQGLIIDQRRAVIKQAELYAKSTYSVRQNLLNTLFYEGTIEFLKWTSAYHQMQLFQNAFNLANERFLGVKGSYYGGDLPAIDTLEAYIQVQVRLVTLNQAIVNYKNSTFDLSNFLWYENNLPLEITDKLRPPSFEQLIPTRTISLELVQSLLMGLKENHPALQLYDFKLKQLDVERKWNVEQMKPRLTLNYNLINEPLGGDVFAGMSDKNYKWGFDFSVPLYLREARGSLGKTKIQIQETQFDMDLKWLELSNKLRSYYNEYIALDQQIKVYDAATSNYFTLLSAEKQKFNIGESSVFLINSRETAYIQAAMKQIELKIKYHMAIAEFNYAGAQW